MASKQLVHGFPLPGRGSGVDSRIVTSNHSGPWDETAPWSAPVLWSSSDTTFHHFGGHNQIYTLDLEKNEIITNDLDPSVDWADSRFLGTHQDKIILQIATSKANLPHEEVQFSIAILQLSPNGLNSNYQHPIFSHAERPPILKISRYQDGIVQNQPRLWVWDDQGLSLSAAFPDLNSFQRILDKSQLAALLRDQYPGADYEVEDILEESVNEVLLFLRATDENAPFRALLVSVPVPGSTAGSER